jgi:hypothetical protein
VEEDRHKPILRRRSIPTAKLLLPLYTGARSTESEHTTVPDIDDSYSRQARINWPALYAGENVVWRGKPLQSKYTMKDARQTLAGLPVAIFMTFWMSMALRIPKKDGPIAWLFPAFGILFVVQALYLLVGHYLRNRLEWKNVEYAVTNRRTIIRRGLWRVSEVSRPHSDAPIEVRASSDGAVGSVIFQGPKPSLNGFGQQITSMFNPEFRTGAFGLYALENPAHVYRIILAQTSPAPNVVVNSV